jgi:hypothetical protein
VGECEDKEPSTVADAVGAQYVGPEGRLAIGPGRHQPEASARTEDGGDEPGRSVPSSYSKGMGGIEMNTSSVSSATTASTSAAS